MKSRKLLLFVTACLGCSPSAPRTYVSVADSAGIAIVTNAAERVATASQWRLRESPSLWIQSDGVGTTLFQVTDITRTESGVIAAVNRGTNEVLLFDSAGTLLGRRGREGDGPGEFRWLGSVLSVGDDSIAAYDFSHKRVSIFAPSGELAREFTLSSPEGASDFEQLFNLADGSFAVFSNGGLGDGGPGVFRTMSESYAVDREGHRKGSFGEFPGAEVFVDQMAGMILFGANSCGATVGEELVVGTGKEPEVRFYAHDGSLRRIVRWPDHERKVTEARVEQYLAAAETQMPEAVRPQARSMLARIPKSDSEPAFETILSAPDGELWVGGYRGPEMAFPGARSPVRKWIVFDGDGMLMAQVSTPLGFEPLYVGEKDVIGVFVDEVGVESIQTYEVIRDTR